MSLTFPRTLRSGKNIDKSSSSRNFSKNHPNMNSDINNAGNAHSDSNSSQMHQNAVNLSSQIETKYQIAKLQAEMNEFKGLLSTLNHQFFSCSEEDNALGASSFRNPESIDMVTRASRIRYTAPMTQNMHDYRKNEYEKQIITPTESLDTKKLLTAIHEIPRQIQTSSASTKLLQTNVPYFWDMRTNSTNLNTCSLITLDRSQKNNG